MKIKFFLLKGAGIFQTNIYNKYINSYKGSAIYTYIFVTSFEFNNFKF